MNLVFGTVNMVLGFVGSALKYTFWTTATVVVGAGTVAYATKPTNESFKDYIKGKTTDPNDGVATRLLKNVTTGLVMASSNIEINDYVIIKVAKIRDGNQDHYFIGTLHHWHPVH